MPLYTVKLPRDDYQGRRGIGAGYEVCGGEYPYQNAAGRQNSYSDSSQRSATRHPSWRSNRETPVPITGATMFVRRHIGFVARIAFLWRESDSNVGADLGF